MRESGRRLTAGVAELTGASAALGTFLAFLAVSWWLLIFHFGADVWFLRDDWKFLAGRDGGDLHDIFRPHDVHPSAIPVIVFRLMFNVFGLDFRPYLILIVTMHIAVAALLRVVMRRAGVGPWIATVTAGVLVLFGTGEQNILWAFQINFVGSLLFGLAQLLLADHKGRLGGRDVLGAAAGVAAVMCSGIGPLMVVAVGLSTLMVRGWRVAAVHVGPAALTYVTWVQLADPASYEQGRAPLSAVMDWVREGVSGLLQGIGQHPIVGGLLGALLVTGMAIAVRSRGWRELRERASVPLALLVCCPLLFVLASQGRWFFGSEQARSSRYVYVAAVCLLPALGLAADAVARRLPAATVPVIALLLISMPGNLDEFGNGALTSPRYFAIQRQTMLALPRTPQAREVPRWVRPLPDPYNGDDLTVGWLLDVLEDGRLPEPPEVDERVRSRFPIALGLAQVDEAFDGTCQTHSTPVDLDLRHGDEVGIRSKIGVSVVADGKRRSPVVVFVPASGQTLSTELPELSLRFSAPPGGNTYTLCR